MASKRLSQNGLASPAAPPPLSPAGSVRSGLHVKRPSQNPLSLQEETDDVVFSRNAQELLRRPSFSETLDKVQHSHRGWLKKLASNGRRWNRRYFVIHGHYLSYFKNENTEDRKGLMGALNVWAVDGVTLDKNVIVITLAPDVNVNASNFLTRAFAKKTLESRILLEAKDPVEASKWITAMKVTPFEESPKGADPGAGFDFKGITLSQKGDGDENDADETRSQASSVKTSPEEVMIIKSLHVVVSDDRVFDFYDISELIETTRLRIGELDQAKKTADITVVCESSESGETVKSKVNFRPGHATNGTIKISFPDGGEVHIAWEKDEEASVEELIRLAMAEDNSSMLVFQLAFGMFVATVFIVRVVLEFRFSIAVFTGTVMSGSAAAMLVAPPLPNKASSPSTSDRYVFNSITYLTTRRVASTSVSLLDKVVEHVAAKRKETGPLEDDVSILGDEKPKLEEFRKRIAWLRSVEFVETVMKDGRFDRIQSEWRIEEASQPITAIQDRVCRKYLDHDFRLVRFLRARNLNLEKAEKLVRATLLWRIAVRADYFLEELTLPSWLVEYSAAPLFVTSLADAKHGSDMRIEKWWFRDREGCLSMYFRVGAFDWRKVSRKLNDVTMLMKAGFWALEVGRKDMDHLHLKSHGTIPSYSTAVVDLEGFSLTQQLPVTALIPVARRFFSVLATSYPELLKRVIFVNTPFLFNGIWQAIRPFIPDEVQNKVQIHGRCDIDRHLRPYFTDDQIPAYLGGTAVGENGDVFCTNRLPPVGPFLPDNGAGLLKPK